MTKLDKETSSKGRIQNILVYSRILKVSDNIELKKAIYLDKKHPMENRCKNKLDRSNVFTWEWFKIK